MRVRLNDPQSLAILDRLDRSGDCWLWTGTPDQRGRGHVWHQGRMKLHHRAVWNIMVGEIPPGAFLCHHCDNPRCANPAHLYVGDHLSNVRDMVSRRRGWFQKDPAEAKRRGALIGRFGPKAVGERSGKARLTEEAVQYIRNSGDRIIDMSRKLGVSLSTIHRVKRGDGWRHVK